MAIIDEDSTDHPPQQMVDDEETDQRWDKNRVETFSDGVFAIAITLLVLDLTISAAGGKHLLRALIDLWPSYLAYLTSFSIIGLVWMGHHVIVSLTPASGATSAQATGCCRTT